jgi:hypothetical protein
VPFKIENDKIIVDATTLLGFIKIASEVIPELDGKDLSSITSVQIDRSVNPSDGAVPVCPIIIFNHSFLEVDEHYVTNCARENWSGHGLRVTAEGFEPRYARSNGPGESWSVWRRDHNGVERCVAAPAFGMRHRHMTAQQARDFVLSAPRFSEAALALTRYEW